MKRPVIAGICIIAALIGNAGQERGADATGKHGISAKLQELQGTWKGIAVGDPSQGITITIRGDSLHFHRDADFWFRTTITLPADRDPAGLRATIRGCPESQADSIGKVVVAMYKIEDDKLTLVPLGDGETPKSFEAAAEEGLARYELQKVPPRERHDPSPERKRAEN